MTRKTKGQKKESEEKKTEEKVEEPVLPHVHCLACGDNWVPRKKMPKRCRACSSKKLEWIGPEEIPENECLRCGHKWPQRGEKKPERCPECNSPYWNRERVRPRKKEQEPEPEAA